MAAPLKGRRKDGNRQYYQYTITTQQLTAAFYAACGMDKTKIAEIMKATTKDVRYYLNQGDVKDHIIPLLRECAMASGHLVIAGERAKNLMRGYDDDTIKRLTSIHKARATDVYNADGWHIEPDKLNEETKLAIAKVEGPKIVKEPDPEDPKTFIIRKVYDYRFHKPTEASRQLLAMFGIEIDKRKKKEIEREIDREEGADDAVGSVDFGPKIDDENNPWRKAT